jgi:hypothetical protein
VNILDLRFMPQPNPRLLLFQLEGTAQDLELSYYSQAYVRLYQQSWTGTWAPGWNSVSLDQPLPDLIGPGQRFAVLKATGAKGDPSKKVGRLYILR